MAVDFSNTQMEGAITPSVAVQNPVQDDSGAVLAKSLGGAAQAIGEVAGSIFKQQQTDGKTKILAQYEMDLLDLADDVSQGTYDTVAARNRAAVLRRQYLSMAPELQGDLDKVWSSFSDANGLGHVVVEGTLEQQAQDTKVKAAIAAGYSSVEQYDQFLLAGQQHDALVRQAAAATATNTVLSETMRNGLLTSSLNLADKAYPAAETQMRATMERMEANPAQAAEIAEQFVTQLSTDIAALKNATGTEGADYIVTPINDLLTTFKEFAAGTIGNSVLEGKMTSTKNLYAAMYMNDPEIAAMIAQSAMFKEAGLPPEFAINSWSPEALKKLQEVKTLGSVNLLDNTPASARTTANLTGIAGSITSASSPELVADVNQSLNAAIEGAWVNERGAKDGAIGFKDLVTMLGSPEIGNFLNNGGTITAAHANQLPAILQENYESELVPAIQQFWMSSPLPIAAGGESVVPNDTPMSKLLQPVWNGSVVEFIPVEAYKSDPRVISLAADVNTGSNSIGIPLNNLINAYANVSGVDPKTIWEQDFGGRLFNLGPDGKPVEAPLADRVNAALDEKPTDGETFNLGDFAPDTLEPLEEYSSQASALTASTQAMLPPINPAYTDVEGVDYASYLPSIRAAESGGNDSARNPSSTATGRYQFLTSTWNGLVNKYPNSGLTTDGRTDPQQQEIAIRLFTAENARQLKAGNVVLNNGTLYAAHFLGASDAVKVLNASPTDYVSQYVPAKVINANAFLRGMTVAEFKAWANRKGNA